MNQSLSYPSAAGGDDPALPGRLDQTSALPGRITELLAPLDGAALVEVAEALETLHAQLQAALSELESG
jgi:hypothetical protein